MTIHSIELVDRLPFFIILISITHESTDVACVISIGPNIGIKSSKLQYSTSMQKTSND